MTSLHPLAAGVFARLLVRPAGASAQADPRAPRRRRPVRSIFLAEHYLADVTAASLDALTSSLRAATERLRQSDADVAFLECVCLPGDESCLSLFAAPSAETVRLALRDAHVVADRIVPVLWRAAPERDFSNG